MSKTQDFLNKNKEIKVVNEFGEVATFYLKGELYDIYFKGACLCRGVELYSSMIFYRSIKNKHNNEIEDYENNNR